MYKIWEYFEKGQPHMCDYCMYETARIYPASCLINIAQEKQLKNSKNIYQTMNNSKEMWNDIKNLINIKYLKRSQQIALNINFPFVQYW